MSDKKVEFYMTRRISDDMDADNSFACEVGACISQFLNNQWGILCEGDCQSNRQAKVYGGMVLGAYITTRGKVYIITDDALEEPRVTTVLYADEY